VSEPLALAAHVAACRDTGGAAEEHLADR